MKSVGNGNGLAATFLHHFFKVVHGSHAATCYNRYGNGPRYRLNEAYVETLPGSFVIHGSQQYFAGAEISSSFGPFNYIQISWFAAIISETDPLTLFDSPRLDPENDALRAKTLCQTAQQFRILSRGGIDGDLIGAGAEKVPGIVDTPNAAADREGDENIRHCILDNISKVIPSIQAGDCIHVDKLIDTVLVIPARELPRVPHHSETLQMNPLDQVGSLDV